MMNMIRRHITFYGWVQGVGFRYRARHAAELYGCTGWAFLFFLFSSMHPFAPYHRHYAPTKCTHAPILHPGNDQNLIDEIGDAIISLREERKNILTEAALKHDIQERIEDLISFLDEQTEAVTEYSDPLARRLIEKITVYDEKLVVEFKSGLTVEVEA